MADISLGVVIVTFNSGSEAVDCAETLLGSARSAGVPIRVAIVDNDSTDDTVAQVQAWVSGAAPYQAPADIPFAVTPVPKPLSCREGGPDLGPEDTGDALQVALVQTGANRGFAGGVNAGLAHLAQYEDIRHFWVLNPDSVVPPETFGIMAKRLAAGERYSLMGGRVHYLDAQKTVQTDGGLINWKTGVTRNCNVGLPAESAPPPDPASLDFITGASMVASREFYEAAGPMREDYFLYYEETDWAMRRGGLPLAYCPGMEVYHRAGTSIGSASLNRAATAFSEYFKHRARIRFVRRFRPLSLPFAYLYTLAYTARLLLWRAWPQAWAVTTAVLGLKAPAAIRQRLGPAAAELAFAPPAD